MRFQVTLASLALGALLSAPSYAEGPSETVAVETFPEQAADVPAQDATTQDDAQGQDSALLSEAELEQLAAPIALYPDPLLSEVLIASTYPLEVVQAERWAEKNKDLKGDALEEAVAKEDWDDSIKALVLVPDALSMMNKDLDWTEKLGNAVLAQQADLMDAIQSLRALAKENGQLESNPQQTVTVNQTVVQGEGTSTQNGQPAAQETKEVIVIEPTNPETVYVPYYQPSVVYGTWPYPTYQPYYFPPPPGYAFGGALARGLAWSAGFAIGDAIWGNGFDWGRNDININVDRNFNPNVNVNRNNVNVQKWEHNAYHRRGVDYKNTEVKNKFSNTNQLSKTKVGDGALGDKRPGGGNLGDRRTGEGGPAGNLADRKPGAVGNKRPTVGDMESALKKPGGVQKPGAGAGKVGSGARPTAKDIQSGLKKGPAGAKPAPAKRPSAAPSVARKTPAAKPQAKPQIKPQARPQAKPQVKRPSGSAFQKRDAGAARSAASRGRASVGGRSPSSFSRGRSGGGFHGGGGRGGRRR